jgi:hypothetical protein
MVPRIPLCMAAGSRVRSKHVSDDDGSTAQATRF